MISPTELHARAVESAIFQCLVNARDDPDRAEGWFLQAAKLEQKFTTEYGRHYSHFINRENL